MTASIHASHASRVPPERFPSVLRHAGAVLPVAVKSSQHPAVIVSEYLQKKRRMPPEEKRAVSALVFNTLRLFPLAAYLAFRASAEIGWDFGLAVYSKRSIFSGKFQAADTGLALVAAATRIAAQAFPGALSQDDLPDDVATAIEAFLELHTTCPAPQRWDGELEAAFLSLNDSVKRIVARTNHYEFSEAEMELLAARACVQPWILRSWAETHPGRWEYALALADSLCMPSPVCIRVNGTSALREKVQQEFEELGFSARFGNLSPAALILEERARITDLEAHRNGLFEIQDEGSQLIGYALAPMPGSTALDACAGTGGKTLHLAALMDNTGRITAADPEFKRLKQVLPRAARARFDCIEVVPTHTLEGTIGEGMRTYVAVLVDAPCTSLGTARRYPIPKWRLEEKSLRKIVRAQHALLARYADVVEPGGVLVYATCSLLPQENDEVVAQFLASNPGFMPAPLAPAFARNGVIIPGLPDEAHRLQLTPLDHGTDGFFMARMIRMK